MIIPDVPGRERRETEGAVPLKFSQLLSPNRALNDIIDSSSGKLNGLIILPQALESCPNLFRLKNEIYF